MLLLNPLPQRLDSGATPTFAGLLAGDGTAAAPSISFASQTNKGFYNNASNQIGVAIAGVYSMAFAASGQLVGVHGGNTLQLDGNGACKLTASGTNQNVTLTPSGSGGVVNQLALCKAVFAENGTAISYLHLIPTATTPSATSYAVAGTGVDTYLNAPTGTILFVTGGAFAARILSNGRFLVGPATDSGALLQVGANAAAGYATAGMSFGGDSYLFRQSSTQMRLLGTTTNQGLWIQQSDALTGVIVQTNAGVGSIETTAAGQILVLKSGAQVIALTLDSMQNATFTGSVLSGTSVRANATSYFFFNTRSAIGSPSDGVLTLSNNATTDFSRLQFGGTTASFPALRRVGTALGVRLADDSGDGGFTAGTIVASTCVNISGAASSVAAGVVSYGGTTATTVGAAGGASALPATPLGYIIVNVAGTAAKVPYYNN